MSKRAQLFELGSIDADSVDSGAFDSFSPGSGIEPTVPPLRG